MTSDISGECEAEFPFRIEYRPIGIIHTPYQHIEDMPIQPGGAEGVRGTVEIFSDYREGLNDLEGFSHIILIYHFHRSPGALLRVTPFLDSEPRGVFATRAPRRPNPIGLSVVRLVRLSESRMKIENVDILDGTPLLDIKPAVPQFDHHPIERIGWLAASKSTVRQTRSDKRFG